MNYELYDKYGEYNQDGYYISNHKKWHYYAQRPQLYKRNKRAAMLWMLIPILGFLIAAYRIESMGLSLI